MGFVRVEFESSEDPGFFFFFFFAVPLRKK